MAEPTDAELVARVVVAMGWTWTPGEPTMGRVHDWGSWDVGTGETIDVRDWNPLAVDANGEPTKEAAAQLWEIEGWLHDEVGTLMTGASTNGDSETWWVQCLEFLVGDDEWSRKPVEGQGPTRARALLLTVVAVGEQKG